MLCRLKSTKNLTKILKSKHQ